MNDRAAVGTCPDCGSATDQAICRDPSCSPHRSMAIPISVPEAVHHPAHYGGDTTYEHWKVMVAWGMDDNAFLYNCTKYLCRFGKKSLPLEDLEKAKWYLERAIEKERRNADVEV